MSGASSRFNYPTEARGSLPSFNDIEEEAEFWDTHDTADLTAPPLSDLSIDPDFWHDLAVRLESAALAKLIRLANVEDVSPSALVRRWVSERLHLAASTNRDHGDLPR